MSRFISAGTDDTTTERDAAWQQAQQELEAKQLQKAEAGRQQDGKTLYDTLQANKAAKQEAFEESARLSNQFRSLDEDEITFLDEMTVSERAKDFEVRKETREQVEAFRRQREETEKAARAADDSPDVELSRESWSAGPRKRKKGKEGGIGGVKIRRTSTNEKQITKIGAEAATPDEQPPSALADSGDVATSLSPVSITATSTEPAKTLEAGRSDVPTMTSPSPPAPGLGLVAYSSDEGD